VYYYQYGLPQGVDTNGGRQFGRTGRVEAVEALLTYSGRRYEKGELESILQGLTNPWRVY
jgi:hypothetical protein